MKHLKLFFALFAMLALGVGNAWGALTEEYSYTFTAKQFSDNSTAKTLGSVTWTPATTWSVGTGYWGSDATKGQQWGSSSHTLNKMILTSGTSFSNVKKIEINASIASSGGCQLSVKVGNTTIGTTKTLTTTATAYTFEDANGLTGAVEITLSNGSKKKAQYIKSIKIYTESSVPEKVLSSIEISGDLTKKTYEEGEELDLAGLTVTAKYDDNSEENVTDDVEWSYTPNPLTKGTTSATITATYEDKTATTTITGLTVNEHIITPGGYDITLNNVFFGTTASTNITGPVTGKQNDITVTINGTGSTKPRTDANYTRFYASSTMAISVPSGYVIQSIAITKNESDYAAPSVNVGTFNTSTKTWTGNANSVTMSFSAKSFINSIKVTYALDVKSTLTIETPQNGSISVKNGTTEVTSGTQLSAGTSLVVTPTPASGYLFESLTVDGSEVELSEGKYTFTMPENDVIISATFKENEKPAATLTLSKNGETELLPGNHKQDDVVILPDFESDCSKTFVGWDADENCNHAPTYAPGAEYTLAAETQTLYAVYADGEMGEASLTKMTSADALTNGDKIVIVAVGTKLGMYQETISTSYVKNWELNAEEPSIAELDEKKIWDVVAAEGSWKLGDATNGYLYNSSSNNLAVSITDASTWTIEWQEKGFTLKSNQNRYLACRTDLTTDKKNLYRMNGTSVSSTNGSVYEMNVYKYVEPAASYSNFSTTCAAAPKAEVTPTEVTATAAGVEGKVTVTYENVNTENVAVALFNDEACTEAFTADWLTASLDGDKNITYTVAATTLYTERKAYIQLTAPEANGTTEPAKVVIPVTQAGKEKVFASLADLLANITPTTDATKVTVTLTKEPIVDIYVSGNYRNGIFLNVPYQGTTKEIEIYSRDVPAEWVAGGSVSGTLTNCDWKVYNGIWELCPADWSELTYQEPKAVSTVVVSGAPTKTTYVDGEAFDPAGLTVTVNYNDATTEVNPAGVTFEVTPTTLTKGETAVSVTATFNSVTSVAYEVTGLTVNDIPTKTVAEFIAAGGTRCYLEGIVSNITNTTYGNFDLTDASGTIYVYGCLNAAGESQKFAALGVKNGDKIKVIADEYEFYQNTTPEAKDVQYVSHKSAATIEVADIAMEVGETQTIAATVTPEGAPVTYTIKAGSDNCITLNGEEISAIAAGTATIVATIAETADYMGAEKEITVTVTAVDTRKKAVSPSPFTATSGELNPNDITYSASKGGGTGGPTIKDNYIQLYQIASGQTYGGFITFNAVKGCKIDQVMIVTGNTTTTHIAYSVNDVMSATTEDVQKNAEYITEAGLNAESVNIYCMHTNKNNRLFIASAIVYYTGQPLADPELSWTSNAVELRVGEAFTAPTLNNPYNVTGITYSSDNESLAKVNATTGVASLVADATGTATITATFDGNDTYKAAVVSYTITVKPALVYGVWELVTDDTSLAAGDKVVIVAKDYEFALSATQGNNNRGQAEVTKNNDNTVAFGNDVQVLTLEAGTVDNTFALNTGKGYLYAVSSSSNYLKTQSNKDANASWKITITDGTASIVAQGANTRNTMQYNQSSSLFACYSSASQKALCLYMKKNVKVEGETDNTSIPNQSDVTVDNAELTVTTEAEYDNMYIGNNGSVDVEETVTVNNLYIQTTMGTTTSGQLNTAPENLIVNGDVFIDITLGKNGDPSQWHAFTVPFPVDAANGVFDLNDKKLTNGVNYAIMQYHGDVRAQGKYGWKKYSGVLVPGTFYLMTVDGACTTYRFKKVKDAELVAANTKSLSAYTGGGKTTDHGWNGVGNPTLMYGKVAFDAQILDPESYTYQTIPASSAHFTVGTPFFIQAAADAMVTIAAEVSGSLAPARRAAATVDKVKVMLGNADYTDYLYVSASKDATNEYEIGKDLAKMTMTNTPIVPQIFAQAYGTYLCMVNAPMISNEATVALNLYAPAEGEYTLSVEEQANATVYLLYNGNIVWNLSMGEYPIHLSQGNNAGYSLVVRRENAPTDVENIFGADEQTEKFIYNGKLYILHDGKVFDAVGNVLK